MSQQTTATPNLTLTMSSGEGVPPGAYQATFEGFESIEANEAKGYGPGLRWKWKVDTGDHAGRIASRITGQKPSPKNACGKMLTALAGRTLAAGEAFNLAQCVGKRYMVMVAQGQEGGTRVETAVPLT